MLQLYDIGHAKIDGLTNYKELKLEREINIDDTLSFLYPVSDIKHDFILEESYIRTQDNEYIVKEVNFKDDDWTEYICKINIEGIKGKDISHFETVEQSCTNSVNLALVGTGWTIGSCNVTKLRTVRKNNCNAYIVLQEIQSVYGCEMTFDAITKKVYIYQSMGTDKGSYFAEQLNLKKLDVQRNSYDYITRLIPLGKDGLDIASVNGGLNYVQNNQYSNKIITTFWEDNRYTDALSLLEDATARLDYLSKPYKAYKADVIDLANIKPTWVGGRNLLPDSDAEKTSSDVPAAEYVGVDITEIAITNLNKVVTFSFDLKSTIAGNVRFYNNGGYRINFFKDCASTTSYQRFTATGLFTYSAGDPNGDVCTLSFYGVYGTGIIPTVKNIKIELGDKATDWTPAPEDNYNQYSILDYFLGDTITLLAKSKNTKEQQRIIKLTEYPDEPERNTCEIANKLLSLEYLQVRFIDTADVVDTVTTVDGLVDGTKVDGIDWNILQNVHVVTADIQDASITTAKIGNLQVTTALIADASITNVKIDRASINKLKVVTADIVDAQITTAKIGSLAVSTAQIQDAAITTAKIGNAQILSAKIADAQITTAKIALGAITTALINAAAIGTTQIADASITNAKVVDLSANSITAGTLSVDRLVIRGATTSLVYAINNISGALQSQNVNTLNGETLTPRTITADRIVADAITANEIASKTITANEIKALTITAAEIEAGTITATQIAAGTITTNELASSVGAGLNISSNTSITLKADKAYVDAVRARNLVTNGNFANGTTGWVSAGGAMTFSNNILKLTCDGSSATNYLAYSNRIFIGNKKSFLRAFVRTNFDITVEFYLNGQSENGYPIYPIVTANLTANAWTNLSGIITPADNIDFVVIRYTADASTANGKVIEVQEVLAIDLTTEFGAGNEPTKEWGDANILWTPAPEDSPTNASIISAINMTTEAITISANKIGLLGAVNIPNLTADKIVGGTLTLGGVNNVSGVFILEDNTGTTMGTMNNAGIVLNGGTININGGTFYASSSISDADSITLMTASLANTVLQIESDYLYNTPLAFTEHDRNIIKGNSISISHESSQSVGYASAISITAGISDVKIVTTGYTSLTTDGGDFEIYYGLFVGGNISGLSFTDRTPFYEGDAITEIMQIKGDGEGGIDHSTLPLFTRKNIEKRTGTKSIVEEGRDLGAMISVLTVGVQQVVARLEQLEGV